MLAQIILITIFVTKIYGIGITVSTTNDGQIPASSYDNVIINPGVYWSILNSPQNSLTALTVDSGGAFYLTGNTIGSMTFGLGNLKNWGVISVNPSLISTVYTMAGSIFENSGDILLYFTDDSSLTLNYDNWANTGSIWLAGDTDLGSSTIGSIQSTSGVLVNDGDVCLSGQYFTMTTPFTGEGCIHLLGDASFYIYENMSSLQNTFVLNVDSQLLYKPSGATYNVFGFGEGVVIGKTDQLTFFSYDEEIGVLSITAGGFVDKFIIGRGYHISQFASTTLNFINGISDNTALTYRARPPNTVPLSCGQCPSVPVTPGA